MNGKKKAVAGIFQYSGLFSLLRKFPSHSLVVLNYHRIRENMHQSSRFDDDVFFGPDAETFQAQMKWLKSNSDVLSECDLLSCLTCMKFPARPSLVTFDDGYEDNYSIAYPILRALQVPAIYFIATEMVESRQLRWWDLIAYCVKQTRKREISLLGEKYAIQPGGLECIRVLHAVMKKRKAAETAHLIEELFSICDVEFPSLDLQSREIMTWDQIKEVDRNGISIGAHSHQHKVLSTMTKEDQYEDLAICKKLLEERLGRTVRTLAYPVGAPDAFSETTMAAARAAGFEIAFSYMGGRPKEIKQMDLFAFPRVAAPESLWEFIALVSLPEVFYIRD